MNPSQSIVSYYDGHLLAKLAAKINKAIEIYSDKDWNYSRISLHVRSLDSIQGAYALWPEIVLVKTKQGKQDLKTFVTEVAWGERHSNELGILEIVSLRLNKAVLHVSTDESWDFERPFVHPVNKEVLAQQGISDALWYEIYEVAGEEFDNR